jgi:cell division protein FtsQ
MSRTGTTTRDRIGGRRGSPERRLSTPVTPLARRRRPARTHSRRRRWLRVAAGVLLLAGALWFLWAGPLLAVGTVQVDGAGTLSAEEVREVAGIEVGVPLLRVDVEDVEARVARLPQVASVEVTRGWPQTVVVTVVERVPVAVVGEAGRRSLVDADGVLFDTITGSAPRGVVPLDVDDPGPGDPATAAALEALVALPGNVRDDVDAAAATGPEDITLTLTDGTVVLWGGPAESAKKASVLTALLERVADEELEPAGVIDLSTPDAVVLR